jgi:hypothetical protein
VLSDAADAALPTKVVADFAPGTTDCTGANVITLKAKFSPSSLIPDTTPRQLVTWSVVDPDDPSDDPMVDPLGSAGDDNFQPLGTYNQWEAVGGFALTGALTAASVQTEVVGGITEVKFHLSCQPGDNYKFVAQVTVPVYGAIQETSDTLTVWRKLHIESDSMGPGAGPYEPDDAVVDDVPEPIYTYLATAFRPAYIEVALPTDTGEDTPDVRFKYHVNSDTTPDSIAAIDDQGRIGRATISTAGHWVVYVQGAYEGSPAHTNDPDFPLSTDPVAGITNRPRGRFSLTFLETIRDVTSQNSQDTAYVNATIALHEIGAQFSIADVTGCESDPFPLVTPVFCPNQLFIIRNVPQPSDRD